VLKRVTEALEVENMKTSQLSRVSIRYLRGMLKSEMKEKTNK
jgi:hypothetical protein